MYLAVLMEGITDSRYMYQDSENTVRYLHGFEFVNYIC